MYNKSFKNRYIFVGNDYLSMKQAYQIPGKIFFKTITSVLGLSSILLASSCQVEKQPPNVILIITDDQGYGDLACYGNEIIQTPNLDELHNQSYRFTSFHVGTTCAPTRAGLMTGRNANRNGVWHTIGGCSILNQDEITLADIFNDNGYTTAMFGKWHLGDAYPFRPHDRGFNEALYHGGGGITQTPDYWSNDYFDDTYYRNGEPEKVSGYCTDVWFNEALRFIENNRYNPFFCYISTNAPHAPFNVPEEYFRLYEETDLLDFQKRFYGMITNIDENMGVLMKKLQEMGLKENTILVFMSDNGTAAGYKPKGNTDEMSGYNAGMRGTKGSPYEGGHRVPFFIRWPKGNIDGGKDIDALAAHVDLLPTLTELCGIEFSPEKNMDGKSFAGIIKGEEEEDTTRILITDTQRIQWPEKGRNSCVMQDHWRLMFGEELYNIKEDPGQKNNIAHLYPERVRKMKAYYDQWWSEIEPEMKYSYMEIGAEDQDPVIITCHDVHAPSKTIPWNQSLIREGKHQASGYYCIEVKNRGEYKIELSRWPFESKLAINDSIPAIPGSETYRGYPAGVGRSFSSASMEIMDGESYSTMVDNDDQAAIIECNLEKGKYKMRFNFIENEGDTIGAYYIRIGR